MSTSSKTKSKSREIFATGFDISKIYSNDNDKLNNHRKHKKSSSILSDIANFIGSF